MDEPNYPVMELQAENERLKDTLIETLKKRVDDLERENAYLRNLVIAKHDDEERDPGSHMIAPPTIVLKPRFRTMSEVAHALEVRTLNAATAKLSAEDINEKDKTA